MAEVEDFAHGYRYGDYSGVVFYGAPTDGFWLDRLAISDCYIDPLFRGILDKVSQSGGGKAPQVVSDWNQLHGWADANGPVAVAPTDAAEFAEALAQLGPADVAEHCSACIVDDCIRCAVVIREFIINRLSRGTSLFIEDD